MNTHNKIIKEGWRDIGYLQAINDVMDLILTKTCNSENVCKLLFKKNEDKI